MKSQNRIKTELLHLLKLGGEAEKDVILAAVKATLHWVLVDDASLHKTLFEYVQEAKDAAKQAGGNDTKPEGEERLPEEGVRPPSDEEHGPSERSAQAQDSPLQHEG